MEDKIYIGVVGQIACGKGVLVDYLIKKVNFISFSLSSLLHEELKKRNIKDFSRKTLQDLGDQLRQQYENCVLAKRAIKQMEKRGKNRILIEGIRNPGEIEYLKKLPHFILIGVKAKRELRFQRLLKRAKPWDPKDWQSFLTVDRRDLGINQAKSGNQVGKCLAYCDYVLTNNKDIKDFQRKVRKLADNITKT